jgi:serine/threonine protein kinase
MAEWREQLKILDEERERGRLSHAEFLRQRSAIITAQDTEDVQEEPAAVQEQSESTEASPFVGLRKDGKPLLIVEGMESNLPIGVEVDDRYRLERKLAEGRLGTIYEAYDLQEEEAVALKMLHLSRLREPATYELLQRETDIAGRISHGHIVPLLNSSFSEGLAYFVYELMDGGNLKTRLHREGSFEPDQAVQILCALLDGISILHEAMLPHLGIEPTKILFSSGHEPHLLGFGLRGRLPVHRMEPGDWRFYAAPEQWQGGMGDRRADIYACGMLLYKMLTGNLPFDETSEDGFEQWLEQKDRTFEELPEALAEIVGSCLATTPEKRYRSAGELRRALMGTGQALRWYWSPESILDGISKRIHGSLVSCSGKTLSIRGVLKILDRGLAQPSSRLEDGKILVESDPLALQLIGHPTRRDALSQAFERAQSSKDPAELLALEDLPLPERFWALKAAAHFSNAETMDAELEAVEEQASSCKDWLGVSDLAISVYQDQATADLALNRAVQEARTSIDHIRIGAHLRWKYDDIRRARVSLGSAETGAQSSQDWLLLSEAWIALLEDGTASKNAVEKAVHAAEGEGFVQQALLAAEAGRRLGAVPAVIRWGVGLEQAASRSHELRSVMEMWEQMGLVDRARPLAHRRQERLRQELARHRSQLVPLEIALPMPEEPYDEYAIEVFGQQVAEQLRLAAVAKELDQDAVELQLKEGEWSLPYMARQMEARRKELEEQRALLSALGEVKAQAKSIGWDLPSQERPLSERSIQGLREQVTEQGTFSAEIVVLETRAEELGLKIDVPPLPRSKAQLTALEEHIEESFQRQQLEELQMRAGLLNWMNAGASIRLRAKEIEDLRSKVEEQERFFRNVRDIQEEGLEIGWQVPLPEFPILEEELEDLRNTLSVQQHHSKTLSGLGIRADALGWDLPKPPMPCHSGHVTGLQEELEKQEEWVALLLAAKTDAEERLGWAPSLPAMPCSSSQVPEYVDRIAEQQSFWEELKTLRAKGARPMESKEPSFPLDKKKLEAHSVRIEAFFYQRNRQRKIVGLIGVAIAALSALIWWN